MRKGVVGMTMWIQAQARSPTINVNKILIYDEFIAMDTLEYVLPNITFNKILALVVEGVVTY